MGSGLWTCRTWASPPGHFQGRQGRRKQSGWCPTAIHQSLCGLQLIWAYVLPAAPPNIPALTFSKTLRWLQKHLAVKVADFKVKGDSFLRSITKVASSSNCYGSNSSTSINKSSWKHSYLPGALLFAFTPAVKRRSAFMTEHSKHWKLSLYMYSNKLPIGSLLKCPNLKAHWFTILAHQKEIVTCSDGDSSVINKLIQNKFSFILTACDVLIMLRRWCWHTEDESLWHL